METLHIVISFKTAVYFTSFKRNHASCERILRSLELPYEDIFDRHLVTGQTKTYKKGQRQNETHE